MTTNQTSKAKVSAQLAKAQNQLAQFLRNNSESTIEAVAAFPRKGVAVKKPWGDQSIHLFLTGSDASLFDALNAVQLPERFTAIWHLDTKLLEIIYTVYPVEKEIAERSFSIRHKDRTYECFFGDSSRRLLLFAEYYYAVSSTTSSFRNLNPFSDYVLGEQGVEGFSKVPNGRPLCFWIKGIEEWNTDLVLDLVRHLNFYMAYYDTESPQILIHSTPAEEIAMLPQTRFRAGKFPSQIEIRPIEENLLNFWQAARDGDPIQAFLNSYLILEYAAFFYITDEVKRSVRRHLAAPHAVDNIDALTERLLAALSEDKLESHQKMEALLSRCVDSSAIWRELEKNRDFFCTHTKFDGGFTLDPIISKVTAEKDFSVNFGNVFGSKIRLIRNALAHGKEQRTLATITPTTENFAKLEPWVSAVAIAAREAMVYRPLV